MDYGDLYKRIGTSGWFKSRARLQYGRNASEPNQNLHANELVSCSLPHTSSMGWLYVDFKVVWPNMQAVVTLILAISVPEHCC